MTQSIAAYKRKNPQSTKTMWKENRLRSLVRIYKATMITYSEALTKFNEASAKRSIRQYNILEADIPGEELEEKCHQNPVAVQRDLILRMQKYQVSDGTIDKIQELEDQNTQTRDIERGVQQ